MKKLFVVVLLIVSLLGCSNSIPTTVQEQGVVVEEINENGFTDEENRYIEYHLSLLEDVNGSMRDLANLLGDFDNFGQAWIDSWANITEELGEYKAEIDSITPPEIFEETHKKSSDAVDNFIRASLTYGESVAESNKHKIEVADDVMAYGFKLFGEAVNEMEEIAEDRGEDILP